VDESISSKDRAALEAIVQKLQAAWNAGDGDAFAEPFAENADFVTMRAEHMRGRATIASGHNGIFRTIYAGSVVQLTIEALRLLRPDVALLHVHSQLDAPTGPMAGKHGARFSMVLTRERVGWEIASSAPRNCP
jgi:uncharacterized protein (TIGR02246 family)